MKRTTKSARDALQLLWLGAWVLAAVGCGDDDANAVVDDAPDAGGDSGDSGDGGTDDGGPLTLGGLSVTVSAQEQELDLFGHAGHRFWLQVSDEQLVALNSEQGGGGLFPGDPGGDIYTPPVTGSTAYYADHLLVQDALTQSVADYGKLEIALVGESTFRQWNKRQIPNIRIDSNEFVKETRIGTFEHLRLNNSLVGSIFRESIAHRIYRALDYPALRSTHVFLGSNVWGDDVWVPMTLMEMYKRRFCRDNEQLLGGSCENMWEFAGDLGNGGGGIPGPGLPGFPEPRPRPFDNFGDGAADIALPGRPDPRPGDGDGDDDALRVPDAWCQVSSCDNTRLIALMDALEQTAPGAGFKDALDPYIDWERFHEFQCLSWMLWTGDDPIHNSNNNLIIERDTDGRLIWAPYSVDISAGQDWYVNVPLTGQSSIAIGCQQDPLCWEDTIAICEELIVRFDELNPETFVDELVTTLTDLDMMRLGDEQRAEELRQWLVDRQAALTDELERYRYLPDGEGNCPMNLELCPDQTCATPAQCEDRQCSPGQVPCEALGRCVDPNGEFCPSCEGEAPFYCEWIGECVESTSTCALACEQDRFSEWCEPTSQCVPIGNCFWGGDGDGDGDGDGEQDAGVEPRL